MLQRGLSGLGCRLGLEIADNRTIRARKCGQRSFLHYEALEALVIEGGCREDSQ